MRFERWMRWTLGEALARTVSVSFVNVAGRVTNTVGQSFLGTLVIGLVQMIGGATFARVAKVSLLPGRDLVGWCFVFGFFSVGQTVLLFLIFAQGGDMGVVVFIVTLSMIPGALVDWLWLRRARLTTRGWMGVFIGALALWSMLDFAGWNNLPVGSAWMLMAFGIMFMITINQAVTYKVRAINPHVKNFWVGLFTILLCAPSLFLVDLANLPLRFWSVSAFVGLCVIAIVITNLMAYKDDALMAIKKLTMFGVFLTLSSLVGVIVFSDALTAGKVFGVLLFIPAFHLLQTGKEILAKSA